MNCDVEVIEAEPDHEPDQRHHDQGGEQALGVELVLEQRSVPILAQHNVLV